MNKKKPTGKKARRTLADMYARKWCKRHGKCEAEGLHNIACGPRKPGFPLLEWCHIASARILRIRYNPENFLCMCGTHHVFFTNHPASFNEWIEEKWPGRNARIAELERTEPKVDYDYWIQFYKDLGVKLYAK